MTVGTGAVTTMVAGIGNIFLSDDAFGVELARRLGELRQRLGRTLAPYKLPDELRTLSEIPRTAVGKVDLPRLRDLLTGCGEAV